MASKEASPRVASFLDLCAAGAPLAAIAVCLPTCQDQLRLGHAVGRHYRDLVLREITVLSDLNAQLEGCSSDDLRAFTRMLLRLESVQAVLLRTKGNSDWAMVDADGLMQLRLLPALKSLGRLTCSVDSYDNFHGMTLFLHSLSTLTMLEHLELSPHSEVEDDYWDIGWRLGDNLTHLTRLDMVHCRMHAGGVVNMTGLDNLRELHLDGTCMAQAKFAHFSSLRKLSATKAEVDNQALEHLGAATSLQELHLGWIPAISAQGIRHLSSLKALTHLDFSYCTLNARAIRAIAGICSLAVLEMPGSDQSHDGAALAPLSQLTDLHTLNVSSGNVGPPGALHIGKCTRLRSLDISYGRIGGEGVANLVTLSGLERLNLSHNGIRADGAFHLPKAFTRLTCLDISLNNLGVAGALSLAHMTQLRELHIKPIRVRLGKQSVQHLSTLVQLTKCDFRG